MTTNQEPMSADQFIAEFHRNLSSLVTGDRLVRSSYTKGLAPGLGRGSVTINFVNLPEFRHYQYRGGGAESENNRQLFVVRGFDSTSVAPVAKVKIEQLINHIGDPDFSSKAPTMRAKTAHPAKIAQYLAKYLNDVASAYQPRYTHE